MKYTVAWVEIHQETVDAINEDDAIKEATLGIARPASGSYHTTVEALTEVEHHNPAEKLTGRVSGLGKRVR